MTEEAQNTDRETNTARPLVTFALFAYNQEHLIRHAIAGALSQTYTPLEVILSDDHSSDRTFEIMKEMKADYAGPHTVVLNRMPKNSGLAGHINRVMELASGELVVVAAGDDVSLPERVEKNVDFFLAEGRPDSVFSDYIDIDDTGVTLSPRCEPEPAEQAIGDFVMNPRIKGAAHAWTPRLFKEFGPLKPGTLCEDQVIPFRAYLRNRPRYLPLQLVKYRRGKPSVDRRKFHITHYSRMRSSLVSYVADLAPNQQLAPDLVPKLESRLAQAEALLKIWQGNLLDLPPNLRGISKRLGIRRTLVELMRRVR